jgi:hypothetical protein
MRRVEKTEIMEDLKEGLYRMFRNKFLAHILFGTVSRISSPVSEKFGKGFYFVRNYFRSS